MGVFFMSNFIIFMMKNCWFIFFCVLGAILETVLADSVYHKIINGADPEAKCLDGSSPALYIHEGSDPKNILIVISGGGFCQSNTLAGTIEQCYKRSKTDLGSSTNLADQLVGPGILSTLSENKMSEWIKIFIPYCDGSLLQGYRKEPIVYKSVQLYFRGSKIIQSHLKYIDEKYNLNSKEKIVFSGFSAGAIAVTMWNDYMRSMLNQPDKILYTIPDCGIFMDQPNQSTNTSTFALQLKNLASLSNLDEKTPMSLCNNAYPGEQWKCFLTQYNHKFLKGKFMFIQSEYDAWAIQEILGLKCIAQGEVAITLKNCSTQQIGLIEQYRKSYDMFIYGLMQITDDYSFWSIGCSWHVFTMYDQLYDSEYFKAGGPTSKQALESFIFLDQRMIKIDKLAWPNNSPCAY